MSDYISTLIGLQAQTIADLTKQVAELTVYKDKLLSQFPPGFDPTKVSVDENDDLTDEEWENDDLTDEEWENDDLTDEEWEDEESEDLPVIELTDEQFERFLEILDAPAEPNPKLAELFRTPAPWETPVTGCECENCGCAPLDEDEDEDDEDLDDDEQSILENYETLIDKLEAQVDALRGRDEYLRKANQNLTRRVIDFEKQLIEARQLAHEAREEADRNSRNLDYILAQYRALRVAAYSLADGVALPVGFLIPTDVKALAEQLLKDLG